MRGKDPKRNDRARLLRRGSTCAETELWKRHRNRQLGGFKFVRQEPVGPYFVDFLCREQCLIVEIDGGQHAVSDADQKRDALMKALGYRIIRFWNNEVLENLDGVLETILGTLSCDQRSG